MTARKHVNEQFYSNKNKLKGKSEGVASELDPGLIFHSWERSRWETQVLGALIKIHDATEDSRTKKFRWMANGKDYEIKLGKIASINN